MRPPTEMGRPGLAVLAGLWLQYLCVGLPAATASDLVLTNAQVRFVISGKTGSIVEGWRVTPPRRCFAAVTDRYEFENEEAGLLSEETKDSVVSASRRQTRSGDQVLTLRCTNPDLALRGILVMKRYVLPPHAHQLQKETVFENRGRQGWFARLSPSVEADPSFRAQSCYYVPMSVPKLPSREVTATTPSGGLYATECVAQACCLIAPAANLGMGNYAYKVNGRYTYFAMWGDRSGLFHLTPSGWEYCAYLDYLERGARSSVEVRYTLFAGDSADFLRSYLSQPEIEQLRVRHYVPDWVDEVKLSMFCDFVPGFFTGPSLRRYNEVARWLGEGYVLPVLGGAWSGHLGLSGLNVDGDYPVQSPAVQWMREGNARCRRMCPRVKVGPHSWLWAIDPNAPSLVEHPRWGVSDRWGRPVECHGSIRQVALTECRQFSIRHHAETIKNLGFPCVMIDGGVGASRRDADWGNHKVAQWWDWYEFYRGVIDEVRKTRPEAAAFCNHPNAVPSDCSIIEAGINGFQFGVSPWRSLSDIYYFSKLGQRGTAWLSHFYWQPPVDRLYVSYLLALAFKPNLDTRQYRFLRQRVPYIDAAYEIKDARLANVRLSPWWRRDETEVDTFALRQGDDLLLSAINFNKEPVVQTLTADLGPLLDKGKPTFVWTEEVLDPTTLKEERKSETLQYQIPGRVISHTSFQVMHGLGKGRPQGALLRVSARLEPGLVKLLTVGQTPAFVYSVNARPTQLRLSRTLGVDIVGRLDESQRKCRLEVQSTKRQCEVMVYFPFPPANAAPCTLLDGREVGASWLREAGQRFWIVSVSRGRHVLQLFGKPGRFPPLMHPVSPPARVVRERLPVIVELPEGKGPPQGRAQGVTLRVGPLGAYCSELAGQPAYRFTEKAGLSGFRFGCRYQVGSQARAANVLYVHGQLAAENLTLLQPTAKAHENEAETRRPCTVTRLVTSDRCLAITVVTRLQRTHDAPAQRSRVEQDFTLTNRGTPALRNLRLFYYANCELPTEERRARFEPESNLLLLSAKGACAGLASPCDFCGFEVGADWVGPYLHGLVGTLYNRVPPENCSGDVAVSWEIGVLKPGESVTRPVWASGADSEDTLRAQLSAERLLFSNDFSRPTDRLWTQEVGQWAREGRTYRQTAPLGIAWVPLKAKSGRYTIRVRARLVQPQALAAVLFAYADRQRHYSFQWRGFHDHLAILCRERPGVGTENLVYGLHYPPPQAGWSEIKVVVRGAAVKCYLDGRLMCQGAESELYGSEFGEQRKVGLLAYNGEVWFADFTVTEP